MPCLEISLPRLDAESKKRLAALLTDAFARETGFGADIFSVQFREYGPGEVSTGGEIWTGAGEPSFLHALLYCPRLRRKQKQGVVASFGAAFAAIPALGSCRPVIHVAEHPYDNIGVEGKLLSDAYPDLRSRPYYHPLEDPS